MPISFLYYFTSESRLACDTTSRRQAGLNGFRSAAVNSRILACACLLAALLLCRCTDERRKSDAELGLTPQQAAGRRVYDAVCDRCHEPYSTRGKNGPGLKGLFKNPYMAESGLPANEERVTEIIRFGRSKMPGFDQKLTPQEIQDLLAYMHTL